MKFTLRKLNIAEEMLTKTRKLQSSKIKTGHENVSTNFFIYSVFLWNKVFKNAPSKICGRQPLKKLK